VSASLALCRLTEDDAVKLVKKILGDNEVESVLQRLDRLTMDEARATATQTLEVVHDLVQNMRVVIDGEATLSGITFMRCLAFYFRLQGICRHYLGYSKYVRVASVSYPCT
jgi:hypothetical protein